MGGREGACIAPVERHAVACVDADADVVAIAHSTNITSWFVAAL